MVTIKIQSVDDIAAAYLKTFGFSGEIIKKILPELMKQLKTNIDSGDDIIKALDKLVLASAKRTFGKTNYPDEQLTALLKASYLLFDGAKKWGDKIFYADKIPAEMIEALQAANLHQAPDYAYAQMNPQPIVPAVSANIFRKFAKLFRKA